jgi:hypothetical protein
MAHQGHYIQQGQTGLRHKNTSKRRSLRPHIGKYSAQDNLVHTAITGHDVTHRYKEEHSDQKGQMSYRPMSCFTLSKEKDKNEGSCVARGGGGTATLANSPTPLPYLLPYLTTPLQKAQNHIHPTRKVRCTNKRCKSISGKTVTHIKGRRQ